MPRVEPEEGVLDLSKLTTDEWIDYLFDHPVKPLAYWSEDIDPGIDSFEYREPEAALQAVEELFRRFREVGHRFTLEQINQGIWGLWGPDLRFHRLFWNPDVAWSTRGDAIAAMRVPFRDFVAGHPVSVMENCFFMWWDLIAESTWFPDRDDEEDRRRVRGAYFETLLAILDLPDPRCQQAALHGLGHLSHPDRPQTIQRYLDRQKAEDLTPAFRDWLKKCRDGRVM